ncbi:MAG: 50S ribosomal protein L1, partial [Simkania negevensis]|nr:50S ribosomal protein L1 [Simkania negevensis]
SLKMGVDITKSDQQVRNTVLLPHGTGKKIVILVIARAEKAKEALDAGADFTGDQEYLEKIKGGWTAFDALIATPDMMRELGPLGKILGPRGLMPTPKAGTVTMDVKRAVEELKKGKIEFKVDKNGVINCLIGKISFAKEQLIQNLETLVSAILRAKPSTAKGHYLQNLYLSSTMGPGIKIELGTVVQA